MAKRKTFPVVRWTDTQGVTVQCLHEDPGGDYDTLCGTDINDPGCTNMPGVEHEFKNGYITCEGCLNVIKTVLKYYPERVTSGSI